MTEEQGIPIEAGGGRSDMLLAIDVGNTQIHFGVFQGERLLTTLGVSTGIHRLADDYASLLFNLLPRHNVPVEDIKGTAICSVVPPLGPVLEDVCRRYLKTTPLVVGAGIKTGVRLRLDNPREVGADRVVNAAAAARLYGSPAIIIDLGTAITFDVISPEGDYLGGAIAPGMEVAAESLFMRAAKLPRVELVAPEHAIGRNSVTAMQSGIVFGYVGLVEAMVERIRKELGKEPRVVATGGYAGVIAAQTSVIEEVNPDLTLIGLRLIYDLNKRS
jgi:type III pantothenate kinase